MSGSSEITTPGGVLAGVAGQALEPLGDLPELGDLGPPLHRLGQGRALLEGVVEGDVERVGDQLRDLVDVAERHAEHPADVPDHRLGLEHVEGDDLGHPVAAVPLDHVLDHLVAPVVGEVDVHVGHGLAPWVQESLEDEAVTHWIDGGDPEAVGDHGRGRRAPPGAHRDAPVLRVPDEVPDDQEVAGELHLLDDAELVVEPGARLGRRIRVVPVEADLGHLRGGRSRASGRPAPRTSAGGTGRRSARGCSARPRPGCSCRPRAGARRPCASPRPT